VYTQSHVLIGAALGGRIPRLFWAGAIGGLFPDLPSLAILAVLKAFGIHDLVIYGFLYWQNWWQLINAATHSVWVWSTVLATSILLRERRNLSASMIDAWMWPIAFSTAALLHILADLLTQREEGHMSFWPVGYWRFMSPLSYWDPNYFGTAFAIFEVLLGIVLATILFRRFTNIVIRMAVSVAALIYVFVHV
jgi:hypothetical protein